MDSNTHSTRRPGRLAALIAEIDAFLDQDLDGLPDAALVEQALELRPQVDRLEGGWLQRLAVIDARGAAGAEQGVQAGSTAGWLRARLRMAAGTAAASVRTARALFRGRLPQTAAALTAGEISVAHARVVAARTKDLAAHVAMDAEPVLVDAARQLDPRRLGQLVEHLQHTVDPDSADRAAQRRHERRGVWLTPTLDRLVAIDGLLEAEAGQIVLAALEPLARPADAADDRSGSQRTADALTELARRALEGGRLPQTGGVRPQLLVTVDLNSLFGHPDSLGGEVGWAAPLSPEACRRLACDGSVTRVLVSRDPSAPCHALPGGPSDPSASGSDLDGLLRAAMTRLPPVLGGAPSQPLDVGRTSRVVTPAQRHALAVRDSGCVFPGCSRPLSWCEAHHVRHWLDGGPTDLDNLALVCRAHHRAIHEGGWHLARGPDGRHTATPPHRRHRAAA
jgi:hypothetical protein